MEGTLQHAIVGPGGVGGLVGGLLAYSGESVRLIVRPNSVQHYPPQLSVKSRSGVLSAPVSVDSALTQPTDVLWITVKSTDLPPALESIAASAEIGTVVPLLNGIDHITVLRERFGSDKVVPATIAVESERIAAGQIVWRSPFARLSVSSAGQKRLATTLQKLAALGFECRFIDDENTLMWSKLVFLAPLALSTTAAAATIGQVLSHPPRSLELRELVFEACSVALASGANIHADEVMDLFSKLPAEMRSSMQKDVEQGNFPELDAIAGPVLRGGEHFGISVPTTKRLAQQIERILDRRTAFKV